MTDQRQPLLPTREGGSEAAPEGGASDPKDWPRARKWCTVALLSFMAFTVTFTCISIVPVAKHVVRDVGGAQPSAGVLVVTAWELGEAAGPLFLAPLSEAYGRATVLAAANGVFGAATALTALSGSPATLIAARALTGLAVASTVLGPAVVGDMLAPEERGSAMTLMMVAPLVGSAVGPAVGGAVAERLGWRCLVWLSVVLAGACQVLLLFCFEETYRGAAGQGRRVGGMWEAATRPVLVVCSSGVLAALCLFHGLAFTYYYIMAVTLPDILEGVYGQPPSVVGSCFMCFAAGMAMSVALCNRVLDSGYTRRRGAARQPEVRLPLAVGSSLALPACMALYGWMAQLHWPLPAFLLALALLGTVVVFSYLPVFAYIVDAFGAYSASAMAGVVVARGLMGTFAPLGVARLVARLGYGWGFTALAAAGLCLAPVPALVTRFGPRWRQRSRYTRDA